MRKFYLSFVAFSFSFIISQSANAQNYYFSNKAESQIFLGTAKRVIVPQRYKTLALNNQQVKSFLAGLPAESQVRLNRSAAPVMELPTPDGGTARFHVWESSIQEPALQAKFPEIRTFAGQGIDDPYATLRFDIGPSGFHAQVLTVNGSYYIDPYARGLVNDYISYYRTDYQKTGTWFCEVPDVPNFGAPEGTSAACLGTDLRTYRLAVANTGEYAQAPGINAGNNPAILHAAIVTTVNRVVGVYEKELSIRMVLVANNNLIEFLDAATDPFTANNNGPALLNESQAVIDAIIGPANYDIGHTFSTGAGGIAQLNSPCGPSKARGVTGSPSPTGDAYDIDYVAHEMGHQWGGNHSMAGCGSSPGSTKYEVGSGTTIQAYAGICGAENIQPNSDPHFHAISFDEISNFVVSGNGATCAVLTPTGNTLPVIAPLLNNNISIPVSTPFTLTGSATDADGDALTYNWEQWDLQGTQTWNAGVTAPPNNTVPLFKSRIPKTTGSRTFPDIAVILANYPANPPATMGGLKGETLSPVVRPMKFRLTVRDNRANGGGVVSLGSGGCVNSAVYQINVAGTAPFVVTVPNGGESYPGNTTQTVTWNVAGTNAAPFNVSNVRILLSTDGGLTYPTVLVASTANDGSEPVSLPGTPSTTARVRVEAIDNIFFDISNQNFIITVPVAGFDFTSPAPTTVACPAPSTASVTLGTNSIGGYNTPITLSAIAGVPAGTTVTFGTNPVVPGNSSVVTLNNANTLSNGTYNITIQGVSGSITQTRIISFIVSAGAAPVITAQPAPVTVCSGSNAVFTVTATGATSYQWQVSTDGGSNYTNIAGATAATYTVTGATAVQNNNRYRVIVTGQCNSVTSSAAILTVNTAPAITAQPQNITVCAGTNALFSVTATGSGLSYQWQVSTDGGANYTDIPGATSATYTATAVTNPMNGNRYRVIISGSCPSPVTSNGAILTVGDAAVITSQPASTTVCVGQNANFSVTATGTSLTYQWQISTDGGANWTNISGQTATTLTLNAVTAAMTGNQYRVVVFSCTPTGITSNAATLTVNIPVAVGTQPAAVTVCAGANASFTVAATGTGLSFQWQLSTTGCAGTFTNIAGATSATYNAGTTTAAMNGYGYRVVITGACNTVTSNCALLTVNSPVTISTQPADASVCLPGTTSFSITAAGTGITYQWQLSTNGGTTWTDIAGANGATYNPGTLSAAMNGNQYRVVLSGTCTPNLVSNAVTLTVNLPVNITTQPASTAVCEGANAVFTVAATGSTITYQWQVSLNNGPFVNLTNTAPYSGVTTNTLTVANTNQNQNNLRYQVIVSGVPCGAVTSNIATLTVNSLPVPVLTLASYSSITPYTRASLNVTVSPPGNYRYDWYRNNTIVTSIPGTTSFFPVTVDELGEYHVVVTNTATQCASSTNRVTVRDSASNLLFIYPNPSSGQFLVRYYSGSNTNTTYRLNVYDSKGARVYSQTYPITRAYDRMDVNLDNAASGVYMVEVTDNSGKRLASGKVIIN